MKRLIILTIIFFVALGVFVINLPPREMTMKDLHPVIVSPERREVIGIPDTPATDKAETPAITVREVTSRNDPPLISAIPITDKRHIEYYIIIESVNNQVLAKKEAKILKEKYNIEIFVLPPTPEGNVRLSYGKYSSPEEAKSVIKSVRTNIRGDAWIYTAESSVQSSRE
jgi:hypothetical protein